MQKMTMLVAMAIFTVALTVASPALSIGGMGQPVATPVIHHQDVLLYTVYAWERWGNFHASAGNGNEIPYDATRLQVKVYTFPTGEVRAIRIANGVRPDRHINKTDPNLYSWQSHRVQFVNNRAIVSEPGDFAMHQKAIYHSGEKIRRGAGIDLEFTVDFDDINNYPNGFWYVAKDHSAQSAASWQQSSYYVEKVGAAGASAAVNAAHYRVRLVEMMGYSAREVYLPKGAVLKWSDMDRDRPMFLLSGKIRVSADGKAYSLEVEDAACAQRGAGFAVEAMKDSVWAQASVHSKKGLK